jgi:hypothetical protein
MTNGGGGAEKRNGGGTITVIAVHFLVALGHDNIL